MFTKALEVYPNENGRGGIDNVPGAHIDPSRDQSFIPCHRLGFDPARQGITDVIPQVTRIFLKSARRCDNIIQACAFILFFLSSNSWVAYDRAADCL